MTGKSIGSWNRPGPVMVYLVMLPGISAAFSLINVVKQVLHLDSGMTFVVHALTIPD